MNKFYSIIQTKLSAFVMFAGIVAVLLITPSQTFATGGGGSGGGGTGPSFSNAAPGSSSGCGAGTLNNSNATVAAACAPPDAKYCPAPGTTVTYEDCKYSTGNGGTCKYDACTCWGSMENNIWSQFCAPGTGTYTFEVTSVSCTGGGTSLQFLVAPTPSGGFSSVCDLSSVYCQKGSTGDQTHTVNLTSGTCYTLMFDGNAGADCTWNFNINCTQVLGVILLDYGVKLSNDSNSAIFSWEVTSERDVSHYEIQRSSDNSNFETIGKVFAKNDSENRLNYSYIDKSPLNGTSYYRLVQVDVDKTKYNYKTVPLTKRAFNLSIYPNPIANDLNLNFGKDLDPGTEITVYGVAGNVIYSTTLAHRTSQHKIDMNECAKGMYFLSIRSGDLVMQQKFYKD